MLLITEFEGIHKYTKSVLLTSNQLLLYQICDTSRNIVLKKKSIDTEINIFSFKQKIRYILHQFDGSLSTRTIHPYTDFIWLFKYKLYTDEKFLNNIFNEFKIVQQKQCTNNINLIKILRIFNEYLALYFEAKRVQSKVQNSGECGGDSDDDSDTESNRDGEKIILIKSPAYYRTIYYEISLTCLKPFILKLLSFDYEQLSALEKSIYLVNYNFAVKKNFFPKKTQDFDEQTNFASVNREAISSHRLYIKCSICMQSLDFFNQCLELKTVECNLGHKLNRCEKSLLLLSYKNNRSCTVCGCSWNVYSVNDLPKFKDFFIDSQDTCIYCN